MHCVLEYPTPYADANLAKIAMLKKTFPQCYIGYSDHTKPDAGFDVLKAAHLLGAQLIEKHFTLDKKLVGNDHYHAMDAHDAEKILETIDYMDMLQGNGNLVSLDTEAAARMNARRSLVASVDIAKGTLIKREMLTFKRPGTGISPAKIDCVVGKTALCDIAEDDILTMNMFSEE